MLIKELILRALEFNNDLSFTKVSLFKHLGLKEEMQKDYSNALKELIKDNILFVTNKKRIVIHRSIIGKVFIGKFISNKKGYGFVINISAKKGDIKELFIPPKNTGMALHEDIVIASIDEFETGKKPVGTIRGIAHKSTKDLTGTFIPNENGKFGFVMVDDERFLQDIYIPIEHFNGAVAYDSVTVEIIKRPTKVSSNPVGVIKEIRGLKTDLKDFGVESILNEYGLRQAFPRKVLNEADRMKPVSKKDYDKRTDLTNEWIFSIDGEDTKDLDDAISITKTDKGLYRLGVHIADVTHYVKEGSTIDKEAVGRGTSVYLLNTVLPMLPKKLSNDLCSLNPNEKKLAMSVIMDINSNGNVKKYEFVESIIESKARLCYGEVTAFLNGDDTALKDLDQNIKNSLKLSEELALILNKKRRLRGGIAFNFKESKIILDENDKAVDVTFYDRGISNKIIEEFMVQTNEVVAEHFCLKEIPFVYRIHEKPKEDKIENFINFIAKLDIELKENFTIKDLQDIINDVAGTNYEESVNLILLQAMQQARYHYEEVGHFGLGSQYYSHFTSPIRRYPDLQIHRIMKEYLNGKLNSVRKEKLKKIVEQISKSSSRAERNAQKAEIDYDVLKKIEYMSDKLDVVFNGIILEVNNTFAKVLLDNTVEGLLPLANLTDDDYILDKHSCSLTGVKTGKLITIGDRLKVTISDINFEDNIINFSCVELENKF